jgi:hypothetical protein
MSNFPFGLGSISLDGWTIDPDVTTEPADSAIKTPIRPPPMPAAEEQTKLCQCLYWTNYTGRQHSCAMCADSSPQDSQYISSILRKAEQRLRTIDSELADECVNARINLSLLLKAIGK